MSYLAAALKPIGYSINTWNQKWEIENKERLRIQKEKEEKNKTENPKPQVNNYKNKKYKSNKLFKGNYNKKQKKSKSEYDKAMDYARNLFVKECCITDKKELENMINNSHYILNWNKKIWYDFENDEIDMSGFKEACKFKFKRSIFFTSSDFKNAIIKYYGEIGHDFWIKFIKTNKKTGLMIFSKRN